MSVGSGHILIEACIASVASARAAHEGGTDRIELNRELERDGLTPPLDLFDGVRAVTPLPLIVMVRPHDRGYVYTADELRDMEDAIDTFVGAGAEGIVLGVLRDDGTVDAGRLRRLVERAGDREVVFHRAFDEVADQEAALEALIDCGVTRVLTSGGEPSAPAGAPNLARLIERAGDRIEILPGAGVMPENVRDLVEVTGCTQVHGTFRRPGSTSGDTDVDIVRALRERLDGWSKGGRVDPSRTPPRSGDR